MQDISNLTEQQKRTRQKLNMVLNNLEQKLKHDAVLCASVASVIDVIVETEQMICNVGAVQTKVPVLQQRLLDLVKDCESSCMQYSIQAMQSIQQRLIQKGENVSDEYMGKIQNTIDYCVSEYEEYKSSEYYARYSSSKQASDAEISIVNLLLL